MADIEDATGSDFSNGVTQLRPPIRFEEQPDGRLGEAALASTTQSIERFRKVANNLAEEALRRRKGLSVTALNEALGKLPSVWSLQDVQARKQPFSICI